MSRGRSRAAFSSPISTPEVDSKFSTLWHDMVNSIRKAHEIGSNVETVQESDTTAAVGADNTTIEKLQQIMPRLAKEAEGRENEEKNLRTALDMVTQLIAQKEEEDVAVIDDNTNDSGSEPPLKKQRKGSTKRNTIVVGMQVAYRINGNNSEEDEDEHVRNPGPLVGEEEWIQCEVTKVFDSNKFQVQDPEPDENNNPGQTYIAQSKDLIVIPPVTTNVSSLPAFSPGVQVLARYPETTTFYRAEVISSSKYKCKLIFEGEEEEGKETEVDRRLVLPVR